MNTTSQLQEAWDNWCLKAHLERSAGYSDAFKREEAARKDREQLERWNKDRLTPQDNRACFGRKRG